MEFGVWPETAIAFPHRLSSFKKSEAALVALAGRPVTGQVSPRSSSASITDSNADIRIHGASAPLHSFADLSNSLKDNL
jgi:hypothetical protein